jgi:hypothetical protein
MPVRSVIVGQLMMKFIIEYHRISFLHSFPDEGIGHIEKEEHA